MPAWKGIVGRGFTAADFVQYVQTIKLTLWHPQFVVLHNTFIPRLADWHQVPGEQRMQNLQHYYRDTQRWSAGPHLFIADDLIWVFTPLDTTLLYPRAFEMGAPPSCRWIMAFCRSVRPDVSTEQYDLLTTITQ